MEIEIPFCEKMRLNVKPKQNKATKTMFERSSFVIQKVQKAKKDFSFSPPRNVSSCSEMTHL